MGSAASADVTTLPPLSTATHSEVDGHETPFRYALPSIGKAGDQLPGIESLGSPGSPITALPVSSTATQSVGDGHEMAVR